MGWGGSEFFLAESESRLYPHMRAKFGRDSTAVSKKVAFKFISRLYLTSLTQNLFSVVIVLASTIW